MMVNLGVSVICVFIFVLSPCNGQYEVGDSCEVGGSNLQGTCKVVDNCPVVVNQIVNQSLQPTSCGFLGFKQVVCCPTPSTPPSSTQRPPLTRISQQSSYILLNAYYNIYSRRQ